jgi:hypothetical protein
VAYDWIGFFGRNPHGATATVLLEVAFIVAPKVKIWIGGQFVEFF